MLLKKQEEIQQSLTKVFQTSNNVAMEILYRSKITL